MCNSSKNLLKLVTQGVVSHFSKLEDHYNITRHEKSLSSQMYLRVRYTSHIFLCSIALLFGFSLYISFQLLNE